MKFRMQVRVVNTNIDWFEDHKDARAISKYSAKQVARNLVDKHNKTAAQPVELVSVRLIGEETQGVTQ